MPVIHINTNIVVEQPHAFTKLISHEIAIALAKPESYVLVHLHMNQEMCFAGTTDPLAYVELKSLGLTDSNTKELSANICDILLAELGIDPARVYIEFSAPERQMFGWNSGTF